MDKGFEEKRRLEEDSRREKNWKRWGPYLSERQWGTVREDYSQGGTAWDYFTHDHSRSRAYRWGEDGLLGITDRQGRLCFALALWNEKDAILKERLFGLTGSEGNHGEDVKELYYYLNSTPTHSYMKALYKYPQKTFPYSELVKTNSQRKKGEMEFEILDTGAFSRSSYFDVFAEYAKAAPNDILILITAKNNGEKSAPLHILPTLWFRNTWSWGRNGEAHWPKPAITQIDETLLQAEHASLGRFFLACGTAEIDGTIVAPHILFTENETNAERLYGVPNSGKVKDAFYEYVVHGNKGAVKKEQCGTKAAPYYKLHIPSGAKVTLTLRLFSDSEKPIDPLGSNFWEIFTSRKNEAERFYESITPTGLTAEERNVLRQGYAGLFWTKQFYHYSVREWIEGDPAQPESPKDRLEGRNSAWTHLYNRDVISMPDKWEYPWYAAWDLAFHMIPFAKTDPFFAKEQLTLFLREWYMHPNGQLPAYEWAFSDVNPPVHAWAVWRVYKMADPRGKRDKVFLAKAFHKLLLNFTWWVNRKDHHGNNVFSGGFLGLDNIGVFDRSQPLPTGGHLEQADGTAWMAFYCSTMLSIAFELARENPAYEDVASKFFEHFMIISSAVNTMHGHGLWDPEDGFYYDHLHLDHSFLPLKVRSMVGLLPLIAVEILEEEVIESLPGFKKRMNWFLENRPDIVSCTSCSVTNKSGEGHTHRLLAIPTLERLKSILRYLFDENEFLSPYGLRSLSKIHERKPYIFRLNGTEYRVEYSPGESLTELFGGNSNWRGPIWFPVNFLLIEALERYHHFYGDSLQVEFPTGSGNYHNLLNIARDLSRRLVSIFLPDESGKRACHGNQSIYTTNPDFKELVLFYEYFHGDNGRGLGASHQTGWTALAVKFLEDLHNRA